MSPIILQEKQRGELGCQNIIITDGMEMGAITQQYTSAEAAVGSIQAGVDIVLGPKNLVEAFDAVMAAVEKGYKYSTEASINKNVDFIPSGKPGKVYRYEATPAIANKENTPRLSLKDDMI